MLLTFEQLIEKNNELSPLCILHDFNKTMLPLLTFKQKVSQSDLARLLQYVPFTPPQDLLDFYLNYGSISYLEPIEYLFHYYSVELFSVNQHLEHLHMDEATNEKGYVVKNSLGLIDAMRWVWDNDRPEFSTYLLKEDYDFINQNVLCIGMYSLKQDDNVNNFIYVTSC